MQYAARSVIHSVSNMPFTVMFMYPDNTHYAESVSFQNYLYIIDKWPQLSFLNNSNCGVYKQPVHCSSMQSQYTFRTVV